MATVVQLRQGKVRGSLSEGVHTFKGIPTLRHPSALIDSGRHSRSSRGAASETH